MIVIPEIKILEIIEVALKTAELDFRAQTDETKSLLYRIFGTNQVGKFNFFEEAKDLFLRGDDHPRKIETRMMFDAQRASLPTIHISMPSDSPGADGIGVDQGYQEDIVDESDPDNKYVIPVYTRMFDAQYNAIITSDNTLEVLLTYHLLRSMLIAIFDQIEFAGIRNPKLSGQDLQIQGDLIPPTVFARGIGISCSYETTVPSINKNYFLENFVVTYKQCVKSYLK